MFHKHGQSEKPKRLSNGNKKYPAYIPGTRNKMRTHTVDLIPPVKPTYQAISFGGLFIYTVFILLSLLLIETFDPYHVLETPFPPSPEDTIQRVSKEEFYDSTDHRMNLVTVTGEIWDDHIQTDEI